MVANRMILSFTALALTVFTASCSGSDAGGKQTEDATAKQAATEPATLNFAGPNGTDEFNARYGDYIRKKFPNYTVNLFEKSENGDVSTQIAGGAQIDVVFATIGAELETVINPNLQFDISSLMKKQNVDLNRFDPGPIDALKALTGGKMYGLPVLNNVMVMYYNKDLFDKFGVTYPKDGMTWDDVLVLAQKLTRTEQGKPYLGLVVSPSHYLRMNQFSMPLVDAKTNKSTASSDIWKRIYETVFIAPANNATYQDWIKNSNNQLPAKKQFLKDKNLAMFIQLSQLFNAQPEMETMNWDMVSLPVFKDRPGIGSQVYPTYLNVTSISKYKDQAMEAIHYLTTEEHQMERSQQGDMTILKDPAIQNALGSSTRFKNINFKAVNHNKVSPASPKTLYDDVAQAEFEKVLPDVSTGAIDVNTALRMVQEAADKAVAEKMVK